jgi:hypothetical protein
LDASRVGGRSSSGHPELDAAPCAADEPDGLVEEVTVLGCEPFGVGLELGHQLADGVDLFVGRVDFVLGPLVAVGRGADALPGLEGRSW